MSKVDRHRSEAFEGASLDPTAAASSRTGSPLAPPIDQFSGISNPIQRFLQGIGRTAAAASIEIARVHVERMVAPRPDAGPRLTPR